MAKKMTQFYTKQNSNSFSKPIKIGSSAEYITMEDENDNAETLKSYCNRIGDPSNLTSNKTVETNQQRKLVDILNEASETASQALSAATTYDDGSIGQEKLKPITFQSVNVNYPVIDNNTSLSNIIGREVKFLNDLKNFKLDSAGGTVSGNIFSSSYIGASKGIGINNKALQYRDIDNNLNNAVILNYDDEIGLVNINMYQHEKETTGENFIEYYKYGDGRLITIIRRQMSLSLNSSAEVDSTTYNIGQYSFPSITYPVTYKNPPTTSYSILFPYGSDIKNKIATYSLEPSQTTNLGNFQVISLCNANSWSGIIVIYLEGFWK